MKTVLNYRKNILKCFHKVYESTKTYIYIITGRSAGKSRFVPEKLLYDFLKYSMGNIMIFRKHQNSLLRSSYSAIRKVIRKYGLEDDFDFVESRLFIEDKTNGTRFYFFGLDDENKIRSTEMEVGFPFRYWFEEFQENKKLKDLEQIEDILDTFIREPLPEGLEHQVLFTGNRPRNPYNVVNVYLDKKMEYQDEDTLFHKTSYLDMIDNDTGECLLSKQQIKKIEKTKKRDPKTYRWRYHGEAVGDDTQIYDIELMTRLKSLKDLPEGEYLMDIDISCDTGYQISATTYLGIGITNYLNPVILGTFYFSPDATIEKRIPEYILAPHGVAQSLSEKKAPSEYSMELFTFRKKLMLNYNIEIYEPLIDSAEGGLRTQFFKDYGEFLKTVKKKEKDDMIEDSRDVMIERDVYVLDIPENEIFWFEMGKYQRDMSNQFNPKIIKQDDHTCDCWQYWCTMSKDKLEM